MVKETKRTCAHCGKVIGRGGITREGRHYHKACWKARKKPVSVWYRATSAQRRRWESMDRIRAAEQAKKAR